MELALSWCMSWWKFLAHLDTWDGPRPPAVNVKETPQE